MSENAAFSSVCAAVGHGALSQPSASVLTGLFGISPGQANVYRCARAISLAGSAVGIVARRPRIRRAGLAAAVLGDVVLQSVNASLTPRDWNQRSLSIVLGAVYAVTPERSKAMRDEWSSRLLLLSLGLSGLAKLSRGGRAWARGDVLAGAISEHGRWGWVRRFARRRQLMRVSSLAVLTGELAGLSAIRRGPHNHYLQLLVAGFHLATWAALRISFFHRLAPAVGLLLGGFRTGGRAQ